MMSKQNIEETGKTVAQTESQTILKTILPTEPYKQKECRDKRIIRDNDIGKRGTTRTETVKTETARTAIARIIRTLIILFSFLSIMVSGTASAQDIVISKVLYNPLEESGSEAIELFNNGESVEDISFATIRSESQDSDAVIPNNTRILPGAYYLIADSGWSTKKDVDSWPEADHEETLTLYNSDSGIALIINNVTIDSVGWGDPSDIDFGLYETAPAEDVPEGNALTRIKNEDHFQDTENNSNDFFNDINPVFHNSQSSETGQGTISVIATVLDEESESIEIIMPPDEDEDTEGLTYFPLPGEEREIIIQAEIEDSNGNQNIEAPEITVFGETSIMQDSENLSLTSVLFSQPIIIQFTKEPGTYIVNITSGNQSAGSEFIIPQVIGIELDSHDISLESSIDGTSSIIGDRNMSTLSKPTIRNIGNVPIDISIMGSGFFSEEGSLSLDVFWYSFYQDIFVGTYSGELSSEPTIVPVNIEPGNTREFSLRMSPYEGTSSGTYLGNVILMGVAD